MESVKVTVICKTYNQDLYISKCLESLVSQKTNFNYEIIVHDDASTDSTADIVREYEKKYPNLIKAIYQTENQYSQRINSTLKYIFPMAKGEYIAHCEGDDFWVDHYKLQKQFDFMEANPEYVLCGHAAYYASENGNLLKNDFFRAYNNSGEVPIEELLNGWKMATNSLFYRFSARGADDIPFKGDCPNGDFALMIHMALKGKIYYIDELMSAYRVSSVGSLNWIWRSDFCKYKESRIKFIEMLDRIDQYTGYEYHQLLSQKIDEEFFNMYVYIGDIKNARRYTQKYHDLSISCKLKLILKSLSPKFYMFIRSQFLKIKLQLKRETL